MKPERVTEDYRNFVLVAAFYKNKSRGRAFKVHEPQFDVEAGSVHDAMDKLKQRIDEYFDELARSRASIPASVTEYVQAFQAIERRLSEGHRAMLKAHFSAPERTLTASQLAEAAGYRGYKAANLQYGNVGRWLYEEILCLLPERADGSKIYTCALADGAELEAPEDQWRWVLRPEVAAALEHVGLAR
jgi:hypothetical protein